MRPQRKVETQRLPFYIVGELVSKCKKGLAANAGCKHWVALHIKVPCGWCLITAAKHSSERRNTTMAKSRYEYVKAFELDDRILPQTFIVVRIDGRGFSRFTDAHGYIKPNDPRGLALMAQCAAAVMRDWGEAILAFGHSDEFSFVFPPQSTVFGRRAAKVATGIASQFAATFVFYWSRFFDDKALLYPPTFDARCVAYPTIAIASDYLKWRQVDAYINCMYNEAFWALQQKGASCEYTVTRTRLPGGMASLMTNSIDCVSVPLVSMQAA